MSNPPLSPTEIRAEKHLRKTTEKSLESSEEIFRLLVEAVDEYAIFALDPEGYIQTWNLGGQRLKGYKPEEVIGSHFSRFYTREDIERDHPAFELQEASRKGKYEEEGWRLRKDGTRFWANVVITALRGKDGELKGFAKVTRDLTARRHAEEKLRENEERFRRMVEGVQDYAIFMLNPEGKVATWNVGAERNKGYKADEIIGQHFSKFYPQEDIDAGKPDRELRDAIKYGSVEDEGWRIRKDGSRFWANVVITAVYDSRGALLGFSKVTRNLTERKNAEDLLKLTNESLESKVEVRTRELAEQKNRAEAAVKARDEFFSMASHELKTPLSSLKMQTQIRKRHFIRGNLGEFAPEKLPQMFRDDERQIERLVFLVENMLDVSRLTSGNFELALEEMDLVEMIQDVTRRMEPLLLESGNVCSVEAPPHLFGTWDRIRLEQVFTNLLTNAGKYAPNKPVEIQVAARNDRVRISVRDHGKGISAKDQERIFKPFERLRNQNNAAGLGLGLYISCQIVEAHQGRLTIESEPNQGATFVIDLPLQAKENRRIL